MNNKLKVIDLLVKISKGEEVPKKIKFKNTKPIFEYNIRNGKYEYCYKSNKGKNEICELTFLNLKDEIELIEEKKIELPEELKEILIPIILSDSDDFTFICNYINDLIANQNQIIDYLKYKEEEKEK